MRPLSGGTAVGVGVGAAGRSVAGGVVGLTTAAGVPPALVGGALGVAPVIAGDDGTGVVVAGWSVGVASMAVGLAGTVVAGLVAVAVVVAGRGVAVAVAGSAVAVGSRLGLTPTVAVAVSLAGGAVGLGWLGVTTGALGVGVVMADTAAQPISQRPIRPVRTARIIPTMRSSWLSRSTGRPLDGKDWPSPRERG
jgi:hypothetical protein